MVLASRLALERLLFIQRPATSKIPFEKSSTTQQSAARTISQTYQAPPLKHQVRFRGLAGGDIWVQGTGHGAGLQECKENRDQDVSWINSAKG